MKKVVLVFVILFTVDMLPAQDSLTFQVRGYVKDMVTMIFPGNNQSLLDNLVHNRINAELNYSSGISLQAGIRNRIFTGNFKQLSPDFGKNLNLSSNDWLPISALWFDKGATAMHTAIDRLFLEWNTGKWNLRFGRQRVNWGINLSFNPNDIFNAYNFLDFDYEERPGVDAARIQYYYNSTSGLDFVLKGGDSIQQAGTALRWFFNTKGYDFQLLAGLSNHDLSFGTGWAGFLGNTGWKGEISWFIPLEKGNKKIWVASTGIDYSFGSGWFIYGSYLYSGNDDYGSLSPFTRTGRLTAKNLYPYKHTFLSQISYQVSPIMTVSSSIIYSIDEIHPLVFSPGLRINVGNNWDLDFIGQHFIPLSSSQNSGDIHLLFIRIKMSY